MYLMAHQTVSDGVYRCVVYLEICMQLWLNFARYGKGCNLLPLTLFYLLNICFCP